jgi:hypothetical protein
MAPGMAGLANNGGAAAAAAKASNNMVGSECSCDVHLCSLHSVHANLTINMQLRFYSINNKNNYITINMQLRFYSASFTGKRTTTRMWTEPSGQTTVVGGASERSCDVHLCSL